MATISLEIDDYWTEYCELESQFRDIIRYVALIRRHKDVISLKLANLSSHIGNWMESVFYRMARTERYQRYLPEYPITGIKDFIDNPCVDNFRKTFEPYYELSEQRVRVLPHDYGVVKPFEEFSQLVNPEWFKAYSKYKHNREELFNQMTLAHVTNSLAGLFILNVFPWEMREYALKKGIIYSKWGESKTYDTGAAVTETLLSHPHTLRGRYLSFVGGIMAETSIFRFEFRRWKSENDQTLRPSEL